MSLNISDFLCKNCNTPRKDSPPLSQQPPLKIEIETLSSPPPLKIWPEAHLPLPLTPTKRGCTLCNHSPPVSLLFYHYKAVSLLLSFFYSKPFVAPLFIQLFCNNI